MSNEIASNPAKMQNIERRYELGLFGAVMLSHTPRESLFTADVAAVAAVAAVVAVAVAVVVVVVDDVVDVDAAVSTRRVYYCRLSLLACLDKVADKHIGQIPNLQRNIEFEFDKAIGKV